MAGRLLPNLLAALLVLHTFLLYAPGATSVTFTLTNNCDRTVWPGLLSGAGTSPLPTSGFALQKGESRSVDVPANWSGRMWARTLCSTDPSTGHFTCATGDCGSGQVECSGRGAAPPATLAEFTLAGADGKDFYDVSLVDGYNLPMLVQPQGGSGACETTGCLVDLNGVCPNELKVTASAGEAGSGATAAAACKSACEAFGKPEYCCSGEFGNPNTCHPTPYSQLFKNACPRAYSYAYDDGTSTFTCTAASTYVITFCPAPAAASQNPMTVEPKAAAVLPLVNNTMVYLGGSFVSGGASRAPVGGSVPLCLLAALAVSWKLLQQLF